MSRIRCRPAIRWRLMGQFAISAVAVVGGIVAGLKAAEDGTARHIPTAAGSAARNISTEGSRADGTKPSTGGGRIDGYLAGGRWREGSKLVDVMGQFKTSGERIAFHAADGKSRFPCLENLNSERVGRIVAESPPESLDWVVQGTLTEFRNENFLLVTQAVIGSHAVRGAKPASDRRLPQTKGPPKAR